MPQQIPIIFRSAPLPQNFVGNPQQLMEAITARLSAESAVNISFFVSGSTAPASNYGPWLKNELTWWTFDTVTGAYIPQPLEQESLKYIAQSAAPSQSKYVFWIELDGAGKAQAVKYYSGGAWKDIYEDKFGLYSTTSQMNTAISGAITTNNTNYYTKAEIDSEIGGLESASAGYGAFSARQVGNQPFPNNVDTTITSFTATDFNRNSSFNTSTSKFTAGKAGLWQFNWKLQVDNTNATNTDFELYCYLANPGGGVRLGSNSSSYKPPGARAFQNGSGLIQMAVGEQLVMVLITPSLADLVLSNAVWSGTFISS
jgi:hypothetical protein